MAFDWKKDHATEAEKALDTKLVEGVVAEFAENMRRNYGVELEVGMPKYGLAKVCMYVAQVARAQAFGIDPDLLRKDDSEIEKAMLAMVRRAVDERKPIDVILAEEAEND